MTENCVLLDLSIWCSSKHQLVPSTVNDQEVDKIKIRMLEEARLAGHSL